MNNYDGVQTLLQTKLKSGIIKLHNRDSLCWPHPVHVLVKWKLKLLPVCRPDLEYMKGGNSELSLSI